jgi:hypothetical protein
MAIIQNKPARVNAGEPVTAQAWNVIVDAINGLATYLETTEACGSPSRTRASRWRRSG